jgi:hypothetical protein
MATPPLNGLASAAGEVVAGVQDLADREAIRHCLMTYARGIDRCDRQALESVYWPGAIDDHGSFSGTAAEFIDWVLPALQRYERTTHLLGNILIKLDGDTAAVETYFQASHRLQRGEEVVDDLVVGRYLDTMAKRGGEWRIAARRVALDWYQEIPLRDPGAYAARSPLTGARFPDDPVYQLFKR